MVCPTAILMLGHDKTLVFIRTHRILAHGIAKYLSIFPYIRISKVIVAIVLESKRPFSLTIRKSLETVYTIHLKLALTPFYLFLWSVIGYLLHIVLELCTTTITPEDICIAVGSQKNTGIDAVDAFYRLWLTNERSFRSVGDGYSYAKSHSSFRSRGEIEIVLPVSLNTVGCPH